jgi:hypothetical protein
MAKGGYGWSLDGALPVIEDHSRAKHDVLRAYLINYLRILAPHHRSEGIRVTLVDGFAGDRRGTPEVWCGVRCMADPTLSTASARMSSNRALI